MDMKAVTKSVLQYIGGKENIGCFCPRKKGE